MNNISLELGITSSCNDLQHELASKRNLSTNEMQ
jgi:hypothetical protein